MLYAIYEWSNHVKFHLGEPLSTERSFPLSIFLISCKVLQCNVVWLKHPFSCLCGDTLSGNTYYFHELISFFFHREWSRHLSLYTSHTSEHWTLFPFFVRFFLHLLFSGKVHATVFTKPAVTWNLFHIQTLVGKIMNHRIHTLCWNYCRWRY